MDWFDLFAVQGTLKSLLQYHSSKTSILQCSAFFIVQLWHPYVTTGNIIALTRQAFVGKVMSLLFNMLSRLVSFSSKEQASFNFMAAVTICSDFGAPQNKISHCFHCFPIYLPSSDGTGCHDLFIIGDWNEKVGSSELSWSNRQIWLWSTKWSRAKANRVLSREHTGHSKHPLPTTQEMTLHTSSPDGQYQNQNDYVLCSQRWRSSMKSAKTRPGADCGLDHEFLIAKFRLKLKKVGKTTRPFRYDLNQVPYDYGVEVRNRFKIW